MDKTKFSIIPHVSFHQKVRNDIDILAQPSLLAIIEPEIICQSLELSEPFEKTILSIASTHTHLIATLSVYRQVHCTASSIDVEVSFLKICILVFARSRPPDRAVCAGWQTGAGWAGPGDPRVRDPVLVPGGGRQEDTRENQVRESNWLIGSTLLWGKLIHLSRRKDPFKLLNFTLMCRMKDNFYNWIQFHLKDRKKLQMK